MSEVTVIVLAKTPRLGKVKTRLAKRVGHRRALICHQQLVRHTLAEVEKSGLRRKLLVGGQRNHPLWLAAAQRGWPVHRQVAGDLGIRMLRASQSVRGPIIILGCDFPGLTADLLHKASNALAHHPIVILGANDGGYVLLGSQQTPQLLLNAMPWGGPTVLAKTRQKARAKRLPIKMIGTMPDLDTARDWHIARKKNWLKHSLVY